MTKQPLRAIVREAGPFVCGAVLALVTTVVEALVWLPRQIDHKG
jgi:hypothetical protein